MSDSDFTTHETEEFTECDDFEDDMDCNTQLLEPNDFVMLNSAATKQQQQNSENLNDSYVGSFVAQRLKTLTKILGY
jgi:hypothetical protein